LRRFRTPLGRALGRSRNNENPTLNRVAGRRQIKTVEKTTVNPSGYGKSTKGDAEFTRGSKNGEVDGKTYTRRESHFTKKL